MPLAELHDTLLAEFLQRALGVLVRLALVGTCLGEELVGIADELLFCCLRDKVTMRKWEVLLFYLAACQSGAGMTLAYSRQLLQSVFVDAITRRGVYAAQHLCPYRAVADVWLGAMTFDAWGIATDDAYVMEHGGCLNKLPLPYPTAEHLGMGIIYVQSHIGNGTAVYNKNIPKLIGLGIKSFYYRIIINHTYSSLRRIHAMTVPR